jgi:hypothetical protein
MIRFTWLQTRAQTLVAAAAVLAVALVAVITSPHLAHLYDTSVAGCRANGDCPSVTAAFGSNDMPAGPARCAGAAAGLSARPGHGPCVPGSRTPVPGGGAAGWLSRLPSVSRSPSVVALCAADGQALSAPPTVVSGCRHSVPAFCARSRFRHLPHIEGGRYGGCCD